VFTSPRKSSAFATSGATIRHGPHHDAQKSTNTGTRASFTIVSNVATSSTGARAEFRTRDY
jgi:hypothetical protein